MESAFGIRPRPGVEQTPRASAQHGVIGAFVAATRGTNASGCNVYRFQHSDPHSFTELNAVMRLGRLGLIHV